MTKELKMNAIPMTEDAASTVQATNNLEYVNLMEYLPLRYLPTLEEEKNRRIVSNFKRGRCSPELKNQFTDAIKQLKEERKDVKLRVCFIPAITADKTALRYSQLATAIESETGIPSDYHTILPKRATELMATGKTDPAEDFLFNKEQIEGKDIILIGDIITTGTNFTKTCQKLTELGAKSVIGLFLAKTIITK
jgi:predicted amidophosphoribosyltransferase